MTKVELSSINFITNYLLPQDLHPDLLFLFDKSITTLLVLNLPTFILSCCLDFVLYDGVYVKISVITLYITANIYKDKTSF